MVERRGKETITEIPENWQGQRKTLPPCVNVGECKPKF